MRYLPDEPRKSVVLVLSALAALTTLQFPILSVLLHFGVTLLTAWLLEESFRWRARPWTMPWSGLVSALLIGLIIDLQAPLYVPIFAAILAIVPKHVLRLLGSRHLFNPAAAALVLTTFLFPTHLAWWGVAWWSMNQSSWMVGGVQAVGILALMAVMVPVLHRLRRLWLPLGFLALYGLYLLIKIGVTGIPLILDPSVFLFAWVMIPEPKTSPTIDFLRYGFGEIVAVLTILQYELHVLWGDPLLNALLVANLFGAAWLYFRPRPRKIIVT